MSGILFELAGPNYDLARAEIIATLEGLFFTYKIKNFERGVLSLETQCPVQNLKSRLGLTHRIFDLIGITSNKEFSDMMEGYELPNGSIAVRTKSIHGHKGESKKIKERIGDSISDTNRIELDSPRHEIFVLMSDKNYVGRKIYEQDKNALRSREVKNRPYSSPISLKPRFTRALLNLSRPAEGSIIHDPFCGTGGVLIEGYKMGFQMSGGDNDTEMIEGCKKNLEAFDAEARLEVGDVSETIPKEIDRVVTDPPYGRASSTSKEDLSSIYRRMFESAEEKLKEGGYLSAIFPGKKHVSTGKKYLKLIESYKLKVHRSLDRYFTVFQNIPNGP